MRFLCFLFFLVWFGLVYYALGFLLFGVFFVPRGLRHKCKIPETHKICQNLSKLTGEMALPSGTLVALSHKLQCKLRVNKRAF